MAYPVQNLIEERSEPSWVLPGDPVEKALDVMLEHDYSQLPVADELKRPLGMITAKSILEAQKNFGAGIDQLLVNNAMAPVRPADLFRPEDDLFDLLDRLRDTNAVLITDGENRITGIVTSYDSNEFFRRRAEDMMLVEDIENALKELILAAFDDKDGEPDQERLAKAIQKVTDSKQALFGKYRQALRQYMEATTGVEQTIDHQHAQQSFFLLAPKEEPKPFDDLSLYQYTELLLHKDNWQFFCPILNLEPNAIRHLLDGVRETRNALAHFRSEISRWQRDQLRFCSQWLERHQAAILVSWPVSVPPEPVEMHMVRESVDVYIADPVERDIVPTEEALGPADSKYAPLAIWLNSRPPQEDRIQVSFEQIEQIIDADLPTSARHHRTWWANDSVGHVQSRQWLDVGWRVGPLNMTEARATFVRTRDRQQAYIAFFSALQAEMRDRSGFPLKPASPGGQHWLVVASLPAGGPQLGALVCSFGRNRRFRVELYIDTGDQGKNKQVFDELFAQKAELEAAAGEMSWERINDRRASRIAIYRPGHITDAEERLRELQLWGVDTMRRFYDAVAEPATVAFQSAMSQ
jgi:hypothetical protein